jgi:hypothetical protein
MVRISASNRTNQSGEVEQGFSLEGEGEFEAGQDISTIDGLRNGGEAGQSFFESIAKDGKIDEHEAKRLNENIKNPLQSIGSENFATITDNSGDEIRALNLGTKDGQNQESLSGETRESTPMFENNSEMKSEH